MDIVIGTAGHIDHGKTALVKALTGVDADRLPEEKQRGITIDIGFAELDLGDVRASFVDVPGHERFVKNMLAGASGIDLVMLVVAADEGAMPQTREHFNICRLLDIRSGLVVVTKSDLVDNEMLDVVKLDIAEMTGASFLKDAPVLTVSAKTGDGIAALKEAIGTAVASLPERKDDRVAILPIDRSFTMKGHGAVVTGTLRSREIRHDSELELLPQQQAVRIRGIQSHGRVSDIAAAGRRVAVNLGGVDHSEISRGMVLAERGMLRPTQMIDAHIEVVDDAPRPLRSRQRVRVHLGTAEILARITVLNDHGEIEPGGSDFVQLRLEEPTVAIFGERLILRSYSPQTTIAGGNVLDPFAIRHRAKTKEATHTFLLKLNDRRISHSRLASVFIRSAGEQGMSLGDLRARTGWQDEALHAAIDEIPDLIRAGGRLIATSAFDSMRTAMLEQINRHHERDRLSKGISKETLKEKLFRGKSAEIFEAALNSLQQDGKILVQGEFVSTPARPHQLSPEEDTARSRMSQMLLKAQLEVLKLPDLLAEAGKGTKLSADHVRKLFQTLIDKGEVVKVSDEFYFERTAIDGLVTKLKAHAESGDRTLDVPKFKTIAGVSRKYAIPLLEYFDREKVTLRTGDKRVIR